LKLTRRLPQYLLGLIIMASGVVLIKQAEVGISPLSAIPAAISNLSSYTMGNVTIVFHFFCVLILLLVQKRLTLKAVLILPLSVAFGFIIDLLMQLYALPEIGLWLRYAICFGGIVLSGLGIVMIVGADLMLPAPDALLRCISARSGKPLSTVKIVGDVTWVFVTFVIELAFSRQIVSIGLGTIFSMFLTGKFVSIFGKALPQLKPAVAKAPSDKDKR